MPQRREILDSPANVRVREIQGLSRRSARLEAGVTVAEGPQVLSEALAFAPHAITDIFVSDDGAQARPELWRQVHQAAQDYPELWVHHVSKRVSKALGPACQGWVARVALSGFPALGHEVPGKLCLILPATQDPGNLGTLIRLADSCRASAVFVGEDSADPVSPKVLRASTGSAFHLPTPRFQDLEPVVAALKREGWTIAGTSAQGSVELDPGRLSVWNQKIAWMMGNEAHGLKPEQAALCDVMVRIEMYGQAESMNVTSAATLAMWLTAKAQHR